MLPVPYNSSIRLLSTGCRCHQTILFNYNPAHAKRASTKPSLIEALSLNVWVPHPRHVFVLVARVGRENPYFAFGPAALIASEASNCLKFSSKRAASSAAAMSYVALAAPPLLGLKIS